MPKRSDPIPADDAVRRAQEGEARLQRLVSETHNLCNRLGVTHGHVELRLLDAQQRIDQLIACLERINAWGCQCVDCTAARGVLSSIEAGQ